MEDSNYPRPKSDEPNWGRPSFGLSHLLCALLCLIFVANRIWPQWLKDAFETYPLFFLLPLAPAIVLQLTVRGPVLKLLWLAAGYAGALALLWCAGILSMFGGD